MTEAIDDGKAETIPHASNGAEQIITTEWAVRWGFHAETHLSQFVAARTARGFCDRVSSIGAEATLCSRRVVTTIERGEWEDGPLNVWADFITARLDEDEETAKAAEHVDGPRTLQWQGSGQRQLSLHNGRQESYSAVRCGGWARILVARDTGQLAEHIARHDPARVLADVAAKRAVVEQCSAMIRHAQSSAELAGCVLRSLASAYRDHPDYHGLGRVTAPSDSPAGETT